MTRPGACVLSLALLGAAALLVPAAGEPAEGTSSVGMTLKPLEAGDFVRGRGSAPPRPREEWLRRDGDEAPAPPVRISKPFFMGAHEVTNAQYERFAPEHRKWRGKLGGTSADDEPVTYVT